MVILNKIQVLYRVVEITMLVDRPLPVLQTSVPEWNRVHDQYQMTAQSQTESHPQLVMM